MENEKTKTSINAPASITIFDYILKTNEKGNQALSPMSLETALTVLHAGARGNTKSSLKNFLKIREGSEPLPIYKKSDQEVIFRSATSLWTQHGFHFHKSFMDHAQRCCDAKTHFLERPNPAHAINLWAQQHTGGIIKEVFTRVNPDIAMILLNVVYFHGKWTFPFDRADTKNGNFVLANGSKKSHPMMTRTGNFSYQKGAGFQLVRLPYGKEKIVIDLLLPDQSNHLVKMLPLLVKQGDPLEIDKTRPKMGRVTLPRFTVEADTDLRHALKSMGLGILFDLQSADFNNMGIYQGPMALDEVKHKVFIAVDESGTEAAAATTVTMIGGLPDPELQFDIRFDRPFLLAIRDVTNGAILFLAAIRDPGNTK